MPPVNAADRDRFDRLYADNLPLILGYALRRRADRGDAADIAAEVFLTLWRRMADAPDGAERLWLFGVARRVLANHRRGQLRRSALSDRLRTDLLTGGVVGQSEDTTVAVAVARAITQLPERDREVLTLAVWDGLTPTEIATLEGIPAATVRSQLARARTRVRNLLQGCEPIPSAATAPH